ncbi:MAG TPA: tRNA preQ1(34) S-adenosylmethionine ribosyltransferase-isomerase QueA [Tepidisphaeraceae bacterium]|nr:tRNA preQ1(34) S-adenosylmethionine ribosyltransferase-isomerase QueA [Tepidisphaeraceae bacterium]
MRTDDLDFDLPNELIAQTPPAHREDSRLMHVRRNPSAGPAQVSHQRFAELPGLLRPGDVLVFNDARVLPARFMVRKPTGGNIQGLFLDEPVEGVWHVLLRGASRLPIGTALRFDADPALQMTLTDSLGGGEYRAELSTNEPAATVLDRIGRMPLPPYIKRGGNSDERDSLDRERYQTVFARAAGAVAAPTAALHFSEPLLSELEARGIVRIFVTLMVGMGTFKPITAGTLDAHAMHVEAYSISPSASVALNAAKAEGRRIIAVGTTSARVLESQPAGLPFAPKAAQTDIFIRPPYAWKHVEALITNFHLPRSTLIALVAALVGLEEQRRLYRLAIAERYRFFSYGDAMFIE